MSGGTVAQPLSSFSDILQKSRRLNAANMFWPQNVTVYTNIYIYAMANDKKAWPHSSMSDVLASHIKAALNPGLPPGLSEKLRSSPQQITTGLQRFPCLR